MKDRIIEFLRIENKTAAQFAEELGVQPSGISHIISGRNKPSLDFITRMLEKYAFLSTDWLLFGKGSMYKENKIPNLFDQDTSLPLAGNVAGRAAFAGNDSAQNKSITAGNSDKEKTTVLKKIVWFYGDNSFEEYFPR